MTLRNGLGVAAAAAVLFLIVACGGGGGGGSSPGAPGGGGPPPTSTPQATPTNPGTSSQTIDTYPGATNGTVNQFNPNVGDTSSGGQGSPVDGITCDPTMSDNYHVHVFLGIYVNGNLTALPAGVGMENPGAFGSGSPSYPNFIDAATCFYHIHTHDRSGYVHVEDPDPSNVPITGTLYTLKSFFDIWGITVNSNQFGPFSGPVRVFTTGAESRANGSNTTVPATDLTYYGSDANSVPMYSHEIVYIEVGPTWPTTLPNVKFYTEY
jgi:hypothetical protein